MPTKLSLIATTTFLLGLVSVCGGTMAKSSSGQRDANPIVRINEGMIRGSVGTGVIRFLGIPYAAPPTGARRWRPPARQQAWRGVRDATKFRDACPQIVTFGTFAGPASTSEDCLFLNVFMPVVKTRSLKPVIIWVHGGGNIDGASNDYDGNALARGGKAGVPSVVVTLNYRLGVLGFFSHPSIDADPNRSGNYGILDQQAALRWVRRNIAAFGGDPDRVTIAGQSAGAIDVGILLISPMAKGLFQRAILMSSPAFIDSLPQKPVAQMQGKMFAAAAGCPGLDEATARCLRKLPPERILQLTGTPAAPNNLGGSSPFVDGIVVPIEPRLAWINGSFNRVPIMAGSTEDESGFFLASTQYYAERQQPMSLQQFTEATKAGAFCLGCNGFRMPANVIAAYPLAHFHNDPVAEYRALNSDGVKCRERRMLRLWSRYVSVYAYNFIYDDAPFYFPELPEFHPGATHTIDLQFLFKGFKGGILGVNLDQSSGQPRQLNGDEDTLSIDMIDAWGRFATRGDPVRLGTVPWPAFNASGTYMVEAIHPSTTSYEMLGAGHRCSYWDGSGG